MAGPGAGEAMRQLRRQRHHFGDQVAQTVLIEAGLGKGGEKDGVLSLVEEPLEIGEQGLGIVAHRGMSKIKRLSLLAGKTRRRKTLHSTTPPEPIQAFL
ncbi:hypothetical protein D3C72_2173700 [compost metagenome]